MRAVFLLGAVSAALLATAAGAAALQAPEVRCGNLRSAAEQHSLRGARLHGDVTGDGRRDLVSVVEDRRASFRCRFGVAVYSGRRTLVLPLGRFVDWPQVGSGRLWPLREPMIRLLAQLDRERGAEILVAVSSGASSEQSELVTARHGRLVYLHLPRSFGGRLSYGSIVPAGNSFDCVGHGSGEMFEAWYSALDAQGRRWQFELVRYRIAGVELRGVSRRRETRVGFTPPRWWRRYYSEPWPFRHCTVAPHW